MCACMHASALATRCRTWTHDHVIPGLISDAFALRVRKVCSVLRIVLPGVAALRLAARGLFTGRRFQQVVHACWFGYGHFEGSS